MICRAGLKIIDRGGERCHVWGAGMGQPDPVTNISHIDLVSLRSLFRTNTKYRIITVTVMYELDVSCWTYVWGCPLY